MKCRFFLEKLGADAIYNGDLSSLGLEVNDNGELILDIAFEKLVMREES